MCFIEAMHTLQIPVAQICHLNKPSKVLILQKSCVRRVWELMPLAMMMFCRTFISQTSNSSSSGSRQARKEPKKKENHLHTMSKMMGTLVHVQLYTFSYRKPVIQPQNMLKTADWGQKRSKLWSFKMGPQVQPKCFRHAKHMRNN